MSDLPLSAVAQINPAVQIPQGLSNSSLVSFIPMGDVSESGQWTSRQVRPISSVSTGFTSFQEGDVLVAKITPCMENGKGTHAVGLANDIGFGSTEFHVLRARPGNSQRLVFHLTHWRNFRHAAQGQMVGSAGQQRVPRRFFDEFRSAALNADQQIAVAEILDTLDTAIHETEAIIAKLKTVKQGLLHDLLTRGIDANGELRPPQAEAPHFYKQSSLGWIPKEWKVHSLGALGEFMNGLNKPKHAFGSGTKFVNISDVYPDYLDASALGRVQTTPSDLKRYLLHPGDIVVDRSSVKLEGVGYPSVFVGHEEPVVFCGFIIRWRPNDPSETTPRYLCLQMRDARFRAEVFKIATGGANINVNQASLKSLEVVLPDHNEQDEIVARERAFDVRLELELLTLEKFAAEKSALMDDLLTGRVRVTPLLHPTPA